MNSHSISNPTETPRKGVLRGGDGARRGVGEGLPAVSFLGMPGEDTGSEFGGVMCLFLSPSLWGMLRPSLNGLPESSRVDLSQGHAHQ